MKNKKLLLISTIEMLIGSTLTAAAMNFIILPQGFAAGGVTGFSKVITSFVPVSISMMVFIVNMILLAIGLIYEGKGFFLKTIAVSVIFPIQMEWFSHYEFHALDGETVLCVFVAGIMLGVGAGLILRSGASSGGFDILAVVLNEKFNIPMSRVLNITDAFVIIMQALGQPLPDTLYGIFVVTISASLVGKVVTFGTGQTQIMIFSKHHDEIRRALLNDLDVGMTSLQAVSGYKEENTKVILTVVPYSLVGSVKNIIIDIDPTAFVIIDEIHSALGRGYTLDKHFMDNNKSE